MSDFVYDPSSLTALSLEDLASLRGERLVGPWLVLGDDDRDVFARATLLDVVYPGPPAPEFGEDVVEGFLTLSLLDALWNQVMRLDRETTYAMNYGLDRVRFVAPVRLGQRIRLELTVTDVTPRSGGLLLHLSCVVAVDGQARPGLVADWKVIVRPRGGGRYHTQGEEGERGV